MSDRVKYDYTADELRAALRWKLENQQEYDDNDDDIFRAIESLTDDVIKMLETVRREYRDDFQLQVEQYRKAMRRGQVK